MKKIVLVMLLATSFAQIGNPNTATKPLPKISTEDQSQLQALTLRQYHIQLDEQKLQTAYQADEAQLAAVNKEGQDLENKILKKLGLDTTKYPLQEQAGQLVIIQKK